MEIWQQILVSIYLSISLIGMIKGYRESRRGNSYGNCHFFNIIGAFVWGDTVIFGLFWTLVSTLILTTKDWILFLLILSVFWVIRSVGETIYWFNQQFSTINRNPPKKLLGYKIFQNDSIWFIYQIYWQCLTVISIVLTIYFAKRWTSGLV